MLVKKNTLMTNFTLITIRNNNTDTRVTTYSGHKNSV